MARKDLPRTEMELTFDEKKNVVLNFLKARKFVGDKGATQDEVLKVMELVECDFIMGKLAEGLIGGFLGVDFDGTNLHYVEKKWK